jgi:hypothetical protein
MRLGFLELQAFPTFDIYNTVEKPGSRLEYSVKLTDEIRDLGKKISNVPLKFVSLMKAFPSNGNHQEFHADSEEGERAMLYLTDVEKESNGPIEFKEYGKILGKSGTFVHYSANEIHRGCTSDIDRYALAFAFDSSDKNITTIGGTVINCAVVLCPDGFVNRTSPRNVGISVENLCCDPESDPESEDKKFPWVWILSIAVLLLILVFYYFNRRGSMGAKPSMFEK